VQDWARFVILRHSKGSLPSRCAAAQLRAIGTWLGVPGLKARSAMVPIRPQVSAVKRAWRARYDAGL
jgi:hypothetical protein